MNQDLYFFKRAADGQFIFGPNINCECSPGNHRIIPLNDSSAVTIYEIGNRDPLHSNIPVTSFKKENGDYYTDFADLKAGYAGFFFRVTGVGSSGSLSDTGMIFPNSVTGYNNRMVARTDKLCFDMELTATGFAGTESVDEGVTGDWMNKYEFTF